MRRRKLLLLAAVAVVLSLGSGTAYAYFTSSGSGSRSASTATMLTVTVAATAGTPGTALLPGGSGDVTLQLTNPNSFVVRLISVTGNGAITASDGCSPTGVTFTDQTGLSIAIAASGTTQVDLPAAAAMSVTSANACQGTTFHVPVTITVRK